MDERLESLLSEVLTQISVDSEEILDAREKLGALHEKAVDLLERKGIRQSTSVGTGTGGGAVDFVLESVSFLGTKPIGMEFGRRYVAVTLEEKFAGARGRNIVRESIDLKFTHDGDDKEVIVPFKIKGHQVINWLGEDATDEQLKMLDDILDALDDNLPEVSKDSELVNDPLQGKIEELVRSTRSDGMREF